VSALVHGSTRVVSAEANWGRWVARCGWCPSAMAVEPGTAGFHCRECWQSTEVVWPSDDMVQGVERLLMMRPDVSTRNWLPGETLIDLAWENGRHGILSGLAGALVVEDGRIRRDTLPATRELRAIA
jgi:hypothetical protein